MKRFIKNLSVILMIAFMLPGIVQASPVDKEVKVDRIFGGNRVETSIEVSKKAYKGEVDTLFLAGYDGDADALTATFMAGEMDAPLLIANKNKISTKLLQEIKRLNPKEIIILGGDNAVSQTIEEELKAKKYNTRRIKGSSRIETAVNIVEDYYKDEKVKEVFVAEYNSLVDALSIGPVAAKTGVPVLITKKDSVPDELVNFLETHNVEKVTIVGGEGTVSKKGKKVLEGHVKEVGRVYGKNRIETSLNIAKEYFKEPKALFVANGWNNADALIGGYFAGMQDAPIILTNKDRLTEDFTSYVREANTSAYILGGSSVIDKYVFEQVGYLIGDKKFPKPPVKPITGKITNRDQLRSFIAQEASKRENVISINYYGKDIKSPEDLEDFVDEFIAGGTYESTNIWMYGKTFNQRDDYTRIQIIFTYSTSDEQEEFINKEASRIIKEIIKPGMSEFEKAETIYDYMVENKIYGLDGKNTLHSAYGFFKEYKGVCEGFSLAISKLFDKAGMENYVVDSVPWEMHSWNMVKVDNRWYNLDVTWGFSRKELGEIDYYRYFLKSDEKFSENHTPFSTRYLPKATDTRYDGLYDYGDKLEPKPPVKPEPELEPEINYDELEAEVLRLTNID